MTIAEKLKALRKQAGLSQEKLAETISVSRQAITKWETGLGTPDIENLSALSSLFHISIEELLGRAKPAEPESDFMYESLTEYDVDRPKRYDMGLGGAHSVVVTSYDGEKLRIRLASNTLASLQSDVKLKIDDMKTAMDIDLFRQNSMTEAALKEALFIEVQFPKQYITRIEVAVNTAQLEIGSLTCEGIEIDGKTSNVRIREVDGIVELNSNLDMNIQCEAVSGAIEINQISATSRIQIPEKLEFQAVKRGIANTISYERNGQPAECFASETAEYRIELNGLKSELVISKAAEEAGQ